MPTKNMLSKLLFISLFLSLPVSARADRPLVVTTTSTLADLVQQILGPQFEVKSIAKGSQDPHYVEAKPSYTVSVRKAKAVVAVGLDLEVGWLPLVLRGARNPSVLPGNPGFIDASQFITPIEMASGKVDRAQGDVHGLGNPHYLLNPDKVKLVIQGLGKKFESLFPEKASDIQTSTKNLLLKIDEKQTVWKKSLSPAQKFITYHKTLNDFFVAFELITAGNIEPKPGIPPTASHIIGLINLIKQENIKCLLVESFFETRAAQRIQTSTKVGVAVVPVEVAATPKATDWFALIDSIVSGINNCQANGVNRD